MKTKILKELEKELKELESKVLEIKNKIKELEEDDIDEFWIVK